MQASAVRTGDDVRPYEHGEFVALLSEASCRSSIPSNLSEWQRAQDHGEPAVNAKGLKARTKSPSSLPMELSRMAYARSALIAAL